MVYRGEPTGTHDLVYRGEPVGVHDLVYRGEPTGVHDLALEELMPVIHGGMNTPNPYEDAERQEELDARLLGVSVEDWRLFSAEHTTIFGHVPRPDVLNRVYCTHPLHGAIEQDIAVEGVEIALRHERVPRHTTLSVDDPEIDPRFGTKDYAADAGRPWDVPREFEGDDR